MQRSWDGKTKNATAARQIARAAVAYSRKNSGLNNFGVARYGDRRLEMTVGSLWQTVRSVRKRNFTPWRNGFLNRVIDGLSRVVHARSEFIVPQPYMTDEQLDVAHGVRQIVDDLSANVAVVRRSVGQRNPCLVDVVYKCFWRSPYKGRTDQNHDQNRTRKEIFREHFFLP